MLIWMGSLIESTSSQESKSSMSKLPNIADILNTYAHLQPTFWLLHFRNNAMCRKRHAVQIPWNATAKHKACAEHVCPSPDTICHHAQWPSLYRNESETPLRADNPPVSSTTHPTDHNISQPIIYNQFTLPPSITPCPSSKVEPCRLHVSDFQRVFIPPTQTDAFRPSGPIR